MANFSSENTGTWFYIDETKEDDGSVSIRVLGKEESERIEAKTVKKTYKFSHGVRYQDEKVNEKLSTQMMWDYVIADWNNINIDGKEVECNLENKLILMNNPYFSAFIVASIETLNETIQSGKDNSKN